MDWFFYDGNVNLKWIKYFTNPPVHHCLQFNKKINQFLANGPILYSPIKIPKSLWFSGVFRRYKMGTLT